MLRAQEPPPFPVCFLGAMSPANGILIFKTRQEFEASRSSLGL